MSNTTYKGTYNCRLEIQREGNALSINLVEECRKTSLPVNTELAKHSKKYWFWDVFKATEARYTLMNIPDTWFLMELNYYNNTTVIAKYSTEHEDFILVAF